MNGFRLYLVAVLLLTSSCLDNTTTGTVGTTTGTDAAPRDATDTPDTPTSHDTAPTLDRPVLPDVPAVPDVAPVDVPPDGPVTPACCQVDAECGAGRQCALGTCVDAAGAGRCWDGDDCAGAQECINAGVCPCGGVCEQWSDGPGYCVEPGQTCLALDESLFGDCDAELGYIFDGTSCKVISGCGCYGLCDYLYSSHQECQQACAPTTNVCCQGGGLVCPDASVCRSAGGGVDCVKPADPSRCWTDGECGTGETCLGAFICGCDADCDGKDAPGVCITDQAACTTVSPAAIDEVCDGASIVVFDGNACVETGPGMCGCDYFCNLTFSSIDQCQVACGP